MTLILNKPHLLTVLEVWFPKYSAAYTETGERVALLARYKVDQASPVLIVKFTKAQHLIGQRYAIKRADVQRFPIDSNGKIQCYAVPMSALQNYETAGEVKEIVNGLWPVKE